MAIALVEEPDDDEREPTLEELAATANRLHAEAEDARFVWVEKAIGVGEALNAAFALVPRGEWMRWVENNFEASHTWSNYYRRIAYNRDVIAGRGFRTMKAAVRYIDSMGGAESRRGSRGHGERVAEARRLADLGRERAEIAELMGASEQSVRGWLDPERRRKQAHRNRRQIQARKALRRQERDKLSRSVGGSLAAFYSLIRKAAQDADRYMETEDDREVRMAMGEAIAKLHEAEDEIVRALRASRKISRDA